MKRSRMPARTTPLKRVALGRGTGLSSRRTRIAPRSAKREAAAVEEARVREVVFRRDGGCLLRDEPGKFVALTCDQWAPCFGRLTFHHLRKAGQGGPYTEDNGVCLCVLHNEDVENHPHRAREWGLVVNDEIDHDEAMARRVAYEIHR